MGGLGVTDPARSSLRPNLVRRHLQALDAFAQENMYALYHFNLSTSGAMPSAKDPGPEPAFQLDRRVRLERLSSPGSRSKVGFRLVSVPCGRGGGGSRARRVCADLTPTPV